MRARERRRERGSAFTVGSFRISDDHVNKPTVSTPRRLTQAQLTRSSGDHVHFRLSQQHFMGSGRDRHVGW